MEKNEVSIVIVSMNRMDNLNICIPSIEKYTKCKHKIYVVAYMFSKENLVELKKNYPQVIVVESNEIRGFSENNNLALRQVTSEFVFIQNDDTEYKEPVLDKLLAAIQKTPEATVMSPVLWKGDGSLQFCGRGKDVFGNYVRLKLNLKQKEDSIHTNGVGIFKSYNVSGAAFLIRTEDFRNIGFFDEQYFFCPEDIVVGETLNKRGKYCYVDTDSNIIHYEGVSSAKSKLFYATSCAKELGGFYFRGNTAFKRIVLITIILYKLLLHSILFALRKNSHNKDYYYINKMVLKAISNKKSTKQLFIEEYNKVTK